jgi:hypothetical protein
MLTVLTHPWLSTPDVSKWPDPTVASLFIFAFVPAFYLVALYFQGIPFFWSAP